jgi:AraC-like DNA-binding protein
VRSAIDRKDERTPGRGRLACAHFAREAGKSRTAFAERFAALPNITPMQYLSAWRMHVADEILGETALRWHKW